MNRYYILGVDASAAIFSKGADLVPDAAGPASVLVIGEDAEIDAIVADVLGHGGRHGSRHHGGRGFGPWAHGTGPVFWPPYYGYDLYDVDPEDSFDEAALRRAGAFRSLRP